MPKLGLEIAYSGAHMRLDMDKIKKAERLGFDTVWSAEAYGSDAFTPLAYIAAQTQRIRIGHGAVVCVPEMNHPIRIAERCATLDLLSRGRLEVGTARSSTWTELGGFGVDPDLTKKTWDEFVHVLPKLWAEGHTSYDGDRWWLVWEGDSDLPRDEVFHVTLSEEAIEDAAGNELAAPVSFTFTTTE